MTGTPSASPTPFFISRAGADSAVAIAIAETLRRAGHPVTIQDWDFINSSFVNEMHEALAGGARVIALLSPAYLASDFCAAEWQSVIARDPLNRARRLIIMRVSECQPTGLLAPLWYWDLVPALSSGSKIDEVVMHAVQDERSREIPAAAGPYWKMASTVVRADALVPTLGFVGRDDELEVIESALWSSRKPVALYGLAGVGKTSLAREYARRNVDRFAAVWILAGSTETEIIEDMADLGAQLNPTLRGVTDLAQLAQHVVSSVLPALGRPVLLIVDNLDDEVVLHRWLPKGAHAIVTSRSSAWSGDVVTLALGPLIVGQAAAYLARNSGRDLALDDAAAVAAALGSLPLALSHAAAYLRYTKTVSAREYLERLDVHLKRLPPGVASDRAVYATFAEAITLADRNQPGAAALMCLISCLNLWAIPKAILSVKQPPAMASLVPYINGDIVSSLGAVQAEGLRLAEALAELDRLSLIEYDAISGALDVHTLVSAAARQILVGDHIADWAIAAVIAVNAIFPSPEIDNWPLCESLLPHALAALSSLPLTLAFDAAGRLCNQCALYLDDRALYRDAELLYRRSVDIAIATEKSFGRPALALNNLGWFLSRRGKRDEAEQMLRRAVAIVEDKDGPASDQLRPILGNLAVILREVGRVDEAASIQERLAQLPASDGAPALGDTVLMSNRARLLIEAGQLDEADHLLKDALAIERSRHGDNHPAVAQIVENIAELAEARGQPLESIKTFQQALAIFEKRLGPSHPDVGRCLARMATVVAAVRPDEAEALYRRTLSIFQPFGEQHIQTTTRVHNNLGALLAKRGQRMNADEEFRRALERLSEVGWRGSEDAAAVLANRAANFIAQSRFPDAEAALRESLAILDGLVPTRGDVVPVLRMLGAVVARLGMAEESTSLLSRAAIIEKGTHFCD